jgi:hypothetical protein
VGAIERTANVRFGSWLCKNAETRDGDRMNILRNRIPVRKDSPAHLVPLDWRKTILVASQFFAFLHSLGHFLPRGFVAVVAAVPLITDTKAINRRDRFGPATASRARTVSCRIE